MLSCSGCRLPVHVGALITVLVVHSLTLGLKLLPGCLCSSSCGCDCSSCAGETHF